MITKKILEVCLSPDLGGLELFMVECYKSFNTKVVVSPNSKLDEYIEDTNKINIKRNKLFPVFPAMKLASIIDKYDIDILHFHWTKDIVTVVLAMLMSKKKPKIIQTRNMTMTRFKSDFYHRWLYKNIHTMHAVTYQVKEQLEKFIPSDVRPRVEVVYMGTDVVNSEECVVNSEECVVNSEECVVNSEECVVNSHELRQRYGLSDEFIVGIVGRIEEGKGQWIVVEALAKLRELNIKALIVGHTMDEAYLESLKQKVKKLKVEDRVIFTGFTKEVYEHFALMDVAVLATPRETFGLVVIEAMANGVCVIATNNGGPLEIIEDGVDGLLFDRSCDDLAQKLKLLYHDRELKQKLSYNAKKTVESRFEKKKQLNKLYKVLEEMV